MFNGESLVLDGECIERMFGVKRVSSILNYSLVASKRSSGLLYIPLMFRLILSR